MANTNADNLVPDLLDLLDLPHTGPGIAQRRKIVQAVIKAVKAGLQRGESVSIRGFGVFKVETLPARTRRGLIVWSTGSRKFVTSPTARHYQPKKHVVFKPAASLEAWINLKNGYKLLYPQHRATRYWNKEWKSQQNKQNEQSGTLTSSPSMEPQQTIP